MKVGIIGGSGYAGGELLRLLIPHPNVEIALVTSMRYAGEYVYVNHPNLRGITTLKFTPLNPSQIEKECELLFLATPHGVSKDMIPDFLNNGLKIVDLSADFRLKNKADYPKWYGWDHPAPELLTVATYGIPELYREKIKDSDLVACPGCMAVASILAIAPIIKADLVDTSRITIDAKIGSSGGGADPTPASHHPERFGGIRPYKVVGHRHTAEIEQELSSLGRGSVKIAFTPHSVNMARGILVTCHLWLEQQVKDSDIWRSYRKLYNDEHFIRLVKSKKGLHQLPDPKNVVGTNFCDIGFEIDTHANRLVVFSAIDNIVKGAAGQAVQCFNLMSGFDETTGLNLIGFH